MSRLLIGYSDSGVYRGSSKMRDDGVDAMGERVAVGREEEIALIGAVLMLLAESQPSSYWDMLYKICHAGSKGSVLSDTWLCWCTCSTGLVPAEVA
eukprot:8289416-Ditylum_brightwellii.AAC.1